MTVDVGDALGGDLERLVAARKRLGLALSADELHAIVAHLGRLPTETELYAFDAQWSEHCSYKSSRRHLRKLPTEGPTVMQGPAEDAGILHLGEWNDERYGVVIAHESHNHPSQVVPFEGAATGIGGIVRDVLCMGAEVIGLADPCASAGSKIRTAAMLRRASSTASRPTARSACRISAATSTSTRRSTTTCWSTSSRSARQRNRIIHSKAPPEMPAGTSCSSAKRRTAAVRRRIVLLAHPR